MKSSTHAFCYSILFGILQLIFNSSFGQYSQAIPDDRNIYLNAEIGNDLNSGIREAPLKTLFESAKRVNSANGQGAITIILAEGIYGLDATVTFHPANWWFTKSGRLTIRAEHLPDDSTWDPGKMPVIVSTMPLNFKPYGRNDPLHGASYGIQIEVSHVTIQGLRVLGTPVHEKPKDGFVRRNYPIVREGRDLDDLRITQCLFMGDKDVIPNHVSILASGQSVVVDHCVFFNVKDAVVFWNSDRPAEHCEMHHNLFVGNYGASVWSWSLAEDFKFYNNVLTGVNIVWILNQNEKSAFNLSNSLISGFKELVNKGGGPSSFGIKGDDKKLKFGNDVKLIREGKLEIEEDQTKRNYLQLKPGTLGASFGAGLFTK